MSTDTPRAAAALGLGTGRLRSANGGVDPAAAVSLLEHARALGVSHFDTANIYGQGDAERALGAAFADCRDDVHIATKVGYSMPKGARTARRLKPILRKATNFGPMRSLVGYARGHASVRTLSEQTLFDSVSASLDRLQTDYVDLLYLHNPPLPDTSDAIPFINLLTESSNRGIWKTSGVAVGTPMEASAWASTGLVDTVQLPAGPSRLPDLVEFRQQHPRLRIVGRELLAGGKIFEQEWAQEVAQGLPAELNGAANALSQGALPYLRWVTTADLMDIALIGTTKESHLRTTIDYLRGDCDCAH